MHGTYSLMQIHLKHLAILYLPPTPPCILAWEDGRTIRQMWRLSETSDTADNME